MSKSSARSSLRPLPLLGAAAALLLAAACGSGGYGASSSSSSSKAAPAKAAATSSTVHAATSDSGKILVDGQGRAMYAFAADSKGRSACSGACLTYWPPVKASDKPATDTAGVTATFGVLKRSDGTAQLTADGRPMYTYVGDSKPGATTGQGKNLSGGLWWVVSPSGSLIKGDAAKASAATGAGGY
jgi:predicted lipoprotein with Yx(FWY)xxD motif